MPYYFVDGFRDGRTATPLYVQADNEDAALVRAAQLGMEGTGVRPAKALTPSDPDSPKAFAVQMSTIFILLLIDLIPGPSRTSSTTLPCFLLAGMVLQAYCLVYRQKESQQQMRSEIETLKSTVELLQSGQVSGDEAKIR